MVVDDYTAQRILKEIKSIIQPSVLAESTKTETNAVNGEITFSKTIEEIEIFNRDTVDGVFTVNGLNIVVPPETPYQAKVGGTPSKKVTVTGSTSYIIGRYE